VLIVEDEALIRWSLGQTLVTSGALVVEAADARSAMDALRVDTTAFDVAVVDIHLPDGNGLSVLATIRRLCPATRVLLMTAHCTPELLDQARSLGAQGLVEKPFDVEAMAALILGTASAT
jgi:DNA-binding NtrC family response regulator